MVHLILMVPLLSTPLACIGIVPVGPICVGIYTAMHGAGVTGTKQNWLHTCVAQANYYVCKVYIHVYIYMRYL